MEIYPADGLAKLGFPALRERLAAFCLSPLAQEHALAVVPMAARTEVERRQGLGYLLQQRVAAGLSLPLPRLSDARTWLGELRQAGSFLLPEGLVHMREWLGQLRTAHRSVVQWGEESLPMTEFAAQARIFPELEKAISSVVGPTGEVLSSASAKLADIRTQMTEVQRTHRRVLQQALRRAQKEGWTDAAELVLRGNQLLVPIEAGFKHRFNGLVHDLSATGQTVYMEPLEALQLSNRQRELLIAEAQEIHRILVRLTGQLRESLAELEAAFQWVTELDLLQALAHLGHRMEAVPPSFSAPDEGLRLREARHPLLVLSRGIANVVPLHLELSADRGVLIISGPNAGGKSVALQTVGLLQAMAQAGLPIPLSEGSRLPWLESLWVDIGDDQSVQDDLSTYSSHLQHMRRFTEGLNSRALFLIDEFGTGTDPDFGGPIAEALLEAFSATGAYGVVTTHYSNLKEAATRISRLRNAALQFDLDSLSPTYRLMPDVPGSSFALELAARVGIPEVILSRARKTIGTPRANADALLAQVTTEQQRLRARSGRTKFLEEQLEGMLSEAGRAEQHALQTRKQLLAEARAEARTLLQQTRQEIKALLKEARATAARIQENSSGDTETVQPLVQQIQLRLQELQETTPLGENIPVARSEPLQTKQIREGDWLRVSASGLEGEVVQVFEDSVRLAVGAFALTLGVEQLERVEGPAQTVVTPGVPHVSVTRSANLPTVLDVRGMRVTEATQLIQRLVDDAWVGGLPSVSILHGIGSGALREGIRSFLRQNCPQVIRLEDAVPEAGGAGITVCQLQIKPKP